MNWETKAKTSSAKKRGTFLITEQTQETGAITEFQVRVRPLVRFVARVGPQTKKSSRVRHKAAGTSGASQVVVQEGPGSTTQIELRQTQVQQYFSKHRCISEGRRETDQSRPVIHHMTTT